MTRLEAFATYADGTGRVEHTERNDPIGRREMDKAVGAILARPGVVRVRVSHAARTAQTASRRTYR